MQLLKNIEKMPYAVLVILFALISYPTLNSDFLFIDDISLIVNNPQLNTSWSNLVLIFTRPLGQIYDAAYYPLTKFVYYRPGLNLLYMFNATFWGINPVGFHITNLILHLATTLIIYHVGLLLFPQHRLAALMAAALFCVHPVHNELIGRVAMNENLLGLLMAASLFFYLRKRNNLALAVFVCALLTKESAIMLPFIFLMFELRQNQPKAAVRSLAAYGIAMVLYLGVRTLVVGTPQMVGPGSNWVASLLTVFSSLAAYLRLLLVPYPLKIYYPPFELVSPWQSELMLALVVYLLIGYALWRWQSEKLPLTLLAGTIVLLAPVAFNANKMILELDRAFIAERQLYVPSLLFVLLLSSILVKCGETRFGNAAYASLFLLLPLLIHANTSASAAWQDKDRVNSIFFREFPESELSLKNRADLLFKQGDFDAAMAELKAALPHDKQDESVTSERLRVKASVEKLKGFGSMMERYGLAAYQPKYADIHFNLGQIYLAKNDTDAAIRKFKTVLVLKPHSVDARTELAGIYMKKRMFSAASREYKFALKDIDALSRP